QLVRDRKTFMFLLILPVTFTFLFGYAFGGFSGTADSRLPVGYLDQDNSRLSNTLHSLLANSRVIRLDKDQSRSISDLEQLVTEENLAAAIIVPARYGKDCLAGKHPRLTLLTGDSSAAATTVEADILTAANRLDSAVSMALSMEHVTAGRLPFDYAFEQSLSAWAEPPVAITETTSAVRSSGGNEELAHTSPGMMLQFAIAGLLTAAQVIVSERKSRALQRLLTTATRRIHILLGHYLAIFSLILTQFLLLIFFGVFVLHVDYLRRPDATLLVAGSAAMCIAALGLLIGILARSEEQAVTFSLIPMFVFAGLGGAWVPLEVTGPTFQAIGHISPVAWAMDGFKNVSIRGLGIGSVLLPAFALVGYAILFFMLAAWRFWRSEER
ncbi:MAG: ABC transporter permease, partial [Anaerolineae bacterium]|nr:ABC transporter permease [Anaerolineae bacterium]